METPHKQESTRKKGSRYEDLAEAYLSEKGYRILERNIHSRYGEIDIVAEDGSVIVFVEVRMRSRNDYGSPAESITPSKMRKILREAEMYLVENSLLDRDARLDVISILDRGQGTPEITHLTNVSEER
ncbi:MAG TPA: YraN family protein [bacterium]|nr:YraN family protein [bacterium]